MLKGFITGIAVTAVAAVVGGYIFLQTGLIPANADATPGQLETWIASTSLDATLNREAPKGLNPVSMTDTNLIDGINLYAKLRDLPRNSKWQRIIVACCERPLSKTSSIGDRWR